MMDPVFGFLLLLLALAVMFFLIRSWDGIRTQINEMFSPERRTWQPVVDDHPLLPAPRRGVLHKLALVRAARGRRTKRHHTLPHQARHR
jgi:hypothetical protein